MNHLTFLRNNNACDPAMRWITQQPDQSPRALWETCPDGSYMAWALSTPAIRRALSQEAKDGLRIWAMQCAKRAVTVHAPNALLSAAACHPDEKHRAALLKHAETLANQDLGTAASAAAAARYAAAAAAAAAARYAAADAAADRYAAERKTQADDLRKAVRWEWVEAALLSAGVDLRTPAEVSSPR